jgi:hypothetical protein
MFRIPSLAGIGQKQAAGVVLNGNWNANDSIAPYKALLIFERLEPNAKVLGYFRSSRQDFERTSIWNNLWPSRYPSCSIASPPPPRLDPSQSHSPLFFAPATNAQNAAPAPDHVSVFAASRACATFFPDR